jgi:hypothetical protein
MNNVRHGRFALFRNPATPAGTPTRVDSGTDFGTFQVGGFSRFVGMFSGITSMTIRYRMGAHSGDYMVSSTFMVNSGPQLFDVLNFGLYANFDVFAATSQAPKFLVMGEPIR